MIYYCIITAVLNTVTSVALAGAVLIRGRTSGPNLPFFLFILSGGGWSGCYSVWLLSDDPAQALFWTRVLSVVAIMVPSTYYHFVVRLLGQRDRWLVVFGYVVSIALAVASTTPLIVRELAPFGGFPHWPRAGALYIVYIAFFFGYPVMCWAKLLVAMRQATHARRNQLKFIFIGTTLGFLGGGTNFPYWFEINFPPIGNGLIIPYLAGVTYAVIGLRLLEVNYVVIKTAVYSIVAVPLALIHPLAFGALFLITGDFSQTIVAWLVASVPMSIAALLGLPALKRKVDQILERTWLKTFLSGRDRLRDLSYEVAGMREEAEIYEHTTTVVSEALGASAVFYVRSELDATCRVRARVGLSAAQPLPEELDENEPLVALLQRHKRAVILDEVAYVDSELWPRISQTKARFRFEVVVPVHAGGFFYGLLGVGTRSGHRVYSDHDLALLDSICLQIGLHVRARQLERRANQTEKLISLGTLAAGLAHELRNPLVSIKTFSALLDENAGNPEFHREFSATVMRDVGRIESIVENVAAFATDRKVAFSWIRLEEVVRAAFDIVRPSFVACGARFEFEAGEVPSVQGSHNQLTQVVINLLNNAVQAFKGREDGLVAVRLRHRAGESVQPSIELTVADNGPGIDPEVLPRLFEPFTTTKATGDRARKGGMGLGLAIVKRIIDGHNGVIRVDSERGRGTTFTIVLPCEGGET